MAIILGHDTPARRVRGVAAVSPASWSRRDRSSADRPAPRDACEPAQQARRTALRPARRAGARAVRGVDRCDPRDVERDDEGEADVAGATVTPAQIAR